MATRKILPPDLLAALRALESVTDPRVARIGKIIEYTSSLTSAALRELDRTLLEMAVKDRQDLQALACKVALFARESVPRPETRKAGWKKRSAGTQRFSAVWVGWTPKERRAFYRDTGLRRSQVSRWRSGKSAPLAETRTELVRYGIPFDSWDRAPQASDRCTTATESAA
jgi:hypothetical protein